MIRLVQHRQSLVLPLLDIDHTRGTVAEAAGWPTAKNTPGFLRGRAVRQLIKEFHGVGRMCQHYHPRVIQRSDQKSGRGAGAFWHLVIVGPSAIIQLSPTRREDDDQTGRDIQMRLAGIDANRFKHPPPRVAGAALAELLSSACAARRARCLASGWLIFTKGHNR